MRMPAAELLRWMKQFKTGKEQVDTPFGQVEVRTLAERVITRFLKNYNDMEYRQTIGQGLKVKDPLAQIVAEMNISEAETRMTKIRLALGQIAPSLSFTCATVSVSGFNYVYIYLMMEKEHPRIAYISLGDSLVSTDGEWRPMIMDSCVYTTVLKKYASAIDAIAEAAPKFSEHKVNIFHSKAAPGSMLKAIDDFLIESRIAFRLMALAWFIARYEKKHNLTHALSSPEFVNLGRQGSDAIFAIIGGPIADELYTMLASYIMPNNPKQRIHVGQKLIRLTVDEAVHPMNNIYKSWNEVITTRATVGLLLNSISPAFASHSIWFFLHGANKLAYNRPESIAALELSETIRLTPADKRRNKVLAEMAVCMINENCGPTFGNTLKGENSAIIFDNAERYVFDIIFGLLAMNIHLGKIHGDLHRDNATIAGSEQSADGHVIYRLGIEAKDPTYVLRHDGHRACIIDFSRSVDFDNVAFVEHVADKYAFHFKLPTEEGRIFFDLNVYGAIDDERTLTHLAHRASAFDIYEFASSVLDSGVGRLAGSSLFALLTGIKQQAKEILLAAVAGQPDVADELPYKTGTLAIGQSQWANAEIIAKHWQTRDIDKIDAKKVYDIFCLGHELKYSISKWDQLPKSIATTPMIRDTKDRPADAEMILTHRIRERYKLEEAARMPNHT